MLRKSSLSLVTKVEVMALCVCFRREGEGVRVFWDRSREPTFTSRWNPFATDYPYVTFTHHPVRNVSDSFAELCDVRKTVDGQNSLTF